MSGMSDSDDEEYARNFQNEFEVGPDGFLTLPSAPPVSSHAASMAAEAAYNAARARAAEPVPKTRGQFTRRGKVMSKEDQLIKDTIIQYINDHMGEGISWSAISNSLRNIKTPKQIREKWVNNLNPNLNYNPFSREEEQTLRRYFDESRRRNLVLPSGRYSLPKDLVPSWGALVQILGTNRPENNVKNKFNTYQSYWNRGEDPLAHYPLVVSGVADDDVLEEEDDGVVVDMDHDIAGSPEFSPPRSSESQQGSSVSSGDFTGLQRSAISPGPMGFSFPNSPAFAGWNPPPSSSAVSAVSAFSVSPKGGKLYRKARKSSKKAHRKSSKKAHRKSSRKAHRKSSRKAKSG
jgi:hypothetical protein